VTDPTADPAEATMDDVDAATHRRLAAALFDRVWALIDTPDRTAAETDEMIHGAHASRAHWAVAEGSRTVNLARGEWQCARVYAVLGRGEPAVWHATRCLAYVEAAGADRDDWDLGFAYEGLARAHAVAGDTAEARRWKARAAHEVDGVAEADERELLENDLADIPT